VYCINTQELEKDKSEVKWKRVVVNRVLQNSEQVCTCTLKKLVSIRCISVGLVYYN